MYDRTFKRVETKYVLSKAEQRELLKRLKLHIEKDKYFKSKIGNLYFDNKDNELVISSLEKPIFKEKIRLRTYGKPNEVFFEIKNKYDGVDSNGDIIINGGTVICNGEEVTTLSNQFMGGPGDMNGNPGNMPQQPPNDRRW